MIPFYPGNCFTLWIAVTKGLNDNPGVRAYCYAILLDQDPNEN